LVAESCKHEKLDMSDWTAASEKGEDEDGKDEEDEGTSGSGENSEDAS
jgi:hypothetical protein